MKNKYDNFKILTNFGLLYEAHRNCRKGKRWKDSVVTYDLRALESTLYLQYLLESGKYRVGKYHCFTLNERGKIRHIKSSKYKDRVVQKSLCNNILKPVMVPTFIDTNGASIKGKGTDFALKHLKQDLSRHYRKYGTTGYILVGDFRDYFGSLEYRKIEEAYKKYFKDAKIIDIIKIIHASADDGKGRGVPLGNELSQLDALIAASPLDHMIKEQFRIKGYGRYNDDFYLIHNDKTYLKECLKKIEQKAEELGIKLNPKKTKIVPATVGINFLGFHLYLTKTGKVICRIKTKRKAHQRRKLRKLRKKVEDGKLTYREVKQSYTAWKAHAKRGNSYYMLQEMDCYFYSLFLAYLSKEEQEKYEKLKKYKEQREQLRRKKRKEKENGEIIK